MQKATQKTKTLREIKDSLYSKIYIHEFKGPILEIKSV